MVSSLGHRILRASHRANVHSYSPALHRFCRGGPMTSAWERGGLSKGELSKRVWLGINNDDVLGRAAQLAYNFLFAIFPGLLFVTALLGMLAGPGSQLRESLLRYLGTTMPSAASGLVEKTLQETSRASSGGKLALGLILALCDHSPSVVLHDWSRHSYWRRG